MLIPAFQKMGLNKSIKCQREPQTFIPYTHLVWPCTRYLQLAWPGQSQRSCTPDCLQQGCWQLVGRDGCSSSARCTPSQQQSARQEKKNRTAHICRRAFFHHVLLVLKPTCAAMSTSWGSFRFCPSPSFKKSNKLPKWENTTVCLKEKWHFWKMSWKNLASKLLLLMVVFESNEAKKMYPFLYVL